MGSCRSSPQCLVEARRVATPTPPHRTLLSPLDVPLDAYIPIKSAALKRLVDENDERFSSGSSAGSALSKTARRQAVIEIAVRRIKIRRLQDELCTERDIVDALIGELAV